MKKYTFIISTGRTGTLFFSHLFAHGGDNVLSVHEPKPSYHLRVLSNARSSGKITDRIMLSTFLRSRQKIFSSLGEQSHYIESNNFIFGFCAALQKIDSHPTILHIIRDPREYIRSYLNHGAWYGAKWVAANFVPYWQPDVREILKKSSVPITPISRFAAYWLHINKFIINECKNYNNYHLIRFEDVFTPPYSGLEEVKKLVNVQINSENVTEPREKINSGKMARAEKWNKWSVTDCKSVNAICGDMMETLNYGTEQEWLDIISS